MKIILYYIRYRVVILLSFVCFGGFSLFLCLLYGLEIGPFVYALEITGFFLLVFLVMDFIRYRIKYISLKNVLGHDALLMESLPEPKDALEKEYQAILIHLYDELRTAESGRERNAAEQIEYYTMWLHQIKTPISAMRLALQADEEPNPIYGQELFKIERYVEMALQYVKMDDFSGDLVIQEYSLGEILKQGIRKYSTLFIYRKVSLELEEMDATVTTDSKWLSFIIEQLLSNAIKYTNEGKVRIYLEKRTEADIVLNIEDNGIGIRAEDLSRIFEKGYTGYNGRLDKKASGIGLYMAKRAADRLGLGLEIRSQVGRGTRAMIVFRAGSTDEKE